MSEELNFKTLILYLSGIGLALFYLIYMPWTIASLAATTLDVAPLWLYYFVLVLGLMFPLYYAIGEENLAWFLLGLAIFLGGVVWLLVPGIAAGAQLSAVFTIILGLFFFLTPILEPRMGNWDMLKNVFHMIKGLLMILAAGALADWVLDGFIGAGSWNHALPVFIFIGGGLAVVFGFLLFGYGLFKLIGMYGGEKLGKYFKDLAKIFYMLMTLVFLLGITYNVLVYPGGIATFPVSIAFFADMWALGGTDLVAILLIILYIYGMHKVVEKYSQ
ncbi:MAG: hypothetical protein EAX95_15350 [Candidatus Thorarchaeota archaeon]|nr:hypothetical protein [Candidatus Thorarchaeota archaeon]